MALNWTLSLKDNMSAGANAARKSMDKLMSSMQGVDKIDGAMARAQIRRGSMREQLAKAGIASARKELTLRKQIARVPAPKLAQRAAPSSSSGSGVAGIAAGAAIGQLAAQGAATLASKAGEIGMDIFGGAAARQGIDAGLQALTGNAEAAFAKIQAKASEIGAPLLDTAKQVQSLLAGGFKMEGSTGAMRVLEATRALKFINPQANVDNVVMALAQIQSKGKLTAEELHGQLGDAGVNIGLVYKSLAAKMGVSTDEIRSRMQKGAITAQDGIEAVFASIEGTGGRSLNELAKMGATSFNSLKERLLNLPEELGAKMRLTGPLETMSKVLSRVLDQAGGLDLTKTFENVAAAVESITSTLGKVDIVGPLEAVSSTFASIAKAAEKMNLGEALSAIGEVGAAGLKGFGEGLGAAMDGAKGLKPEEIRESAHGFAQLGIALGKITGYAARAFGYLQRLGGFSFPAIDWVVAGWEKLSGAVGAVDKLLGGVSLKLGAITLPGLDVKGWVATNLETITAGAKTLGTAIASGVAAGITGGAGLAAQALGGLATGAIASAKARLESNSPSRLTERVIGAPMGQGAVIGIEREAPQAAQALGGLAAGAVKTASQFASGRQAGELVGRSLAVTPSAGGNKTMNVSGIQVQVIDQQIIADGVIEQLRGALAA